MLDDRASLKIGAYTMVAAGVTVETHTHPFDDFTQPIAISGRQGRPVGVGPNTDLGYNVVVMAGVNLGERCIVGANSDVTKDVPDFTVVGGVPAKPIKQFLPRKITRPSGSRLGPRNPGLVRLPDWRRTTGDERAPYNRALDSASFTQ